MDSVGLGNRFRALRVHIGVRQCDLEGRSGVPRRRIGELEHGIVDHLSLDDLVKLTAALGATIDVRVRWNGEQLDRVVDAAHAATVAAVLERLTRDGWDSVVEASFSVWESAVRSTFSDGIPQRRLSSSSRSSR